MGADGRRAKEEAAGNGGVRRGRSGVKGEGVIVFLHIPRTGGTSFIKALPQCFGESECLLIGGPDNWIRNEDLAGRYRRMGGCRVIAGHFVHGIHEFIDEPVRYVTFLRDPLRRVLSRYTGAFNPLHWIPPLLEEGAVADHLERWRRTFLERARVIAAERNLAARIIAGAPPYPGEEEDETLLSRAMANLENFEIVGISERFSESVELFNGVFGVDVRCEDFRQRSMVTIRDGMLEEGERRWIEERNKLDEILYRRGRSLFEEKREGCRLGL